MNVNKNEAELKVIHTRTQYSAKKLIYRQADTSQLFRIVHNSITHDQMYKREGIMFYADRSVLLINGHLHCLPHDKKRTYRTLRYVTLG